MADYYTLLTNAGIVYETACKAADVPIKLAQVSIGDGNGAVYNPDASAKALKREVWRGPLNALFQDEKNANWLMAEVTIPSDVGGWYVREAGIWTDTGILYAIVKYPESYKPVLATSGTGKEFYIRSIFETSNASIVTLLIDDTVVKATRAWVMDYVDDALGKETYTKAEIDALVAKASALPVGVMVPFPLGVVPPGYLEVDNSLFKDDVYPDLAAYLAKKFNVAGDTAGYTRLPESRGEFLRGWDHGRGIDGGRAIGSYQADALQNIKAAWGDMPRGVGGTSAYGTGAVTTILAGTNSSSDGASIPYAVFEFDASKVVRTSAETRGRNMAVMWCIKAWNAPVNQGNVDIAALLPFVSQTTEINQGTAKVATQAQTDQGIDDATIVTPKKMRWGFSISLSSNGYIALPSWLGGLIVQWGGGNVIASTTTSITFPVAFPGACFRVVSSFQMASGSYSSLGMATATKSGMTLWNPNNVTVACQYLAVGN
ncbi:phage tail-collar fiber domain-containing protein [Pseudomonas antarctica]|uniref:phage tail-collar fiber domain-containing protein n=1 Tax=Pseudomonas antarctica TaxID=219572 RepID=UPI00387A9DD5